MAVGLLSIPREIRDLILDEVVFLPDRPPPLNPSVSQDRKRREYKGQGFFDGHDIWVEKQIRAPPSGSPNNAILLVNRQLHYEAKTLLASKGTHCRLDVMYVKECGLWPTWLAVPRSTRHADSVHVQFRIFDPPADVNPDWKNEQQFRGGDGGPPFIVWNFYAMLSGYLRYGPTAFSSVVADPSNFTIKRLVIDVLPPPPEEKHDRLVSGSSARRPAALDMFERFNTLVMDAEKRERKGITWPRPPEGKESLIPAEKLAFFMCCQIGGLLSMYRDWADFGAVLYEGIGSIEIRVNGEPRRYFDLDDMLDGLPIQPIAAWNEKEQQKRQKRFDDWKAQATATRRSWKK
ncbi:hypothetical protein CH063_00898 [Colletotrichum higginsianum]|uniref:Uncharacterized protein n=2 Tax=Colletotrichum higginsianum TaxID=80884 RepID=H1UYE0_COLHI|nr:hypothetical protein CH63R_11071 [Colletotrichum higginsianum IMI 349063]OBR04368.1 hypothetical protein CH63R_11071 [Colletotrichum higginsianum IMI 349063]TIC89640.1 hypothetical protein CH35J_012716 [Colletotrichum higginsianum]CCF32991.1 hypothetical protein CH063_00898 [Colletotrichum higginsianum]